jgi:hypothetical protein
MIVSTSGRGDPAKINFRILSTASVENKPGSFCDRSTLVSICMGDCGSSKCFSPISADSALPESVIANPISYVAAPLKCVPNW